MKNLGKASFLALLGLMAIVTLVAPSCKKEAKTLVVISVIDTAGKPVGNALVHVIGNGTDSNEVVAQEDLRFNESKTTNGLGRVTFDYSDLTMPGQAGFAVLDVDVSKNDMIGKTVVEVKEHQTNEATVRLRPE